MSSLTTLNRATITVGSHLGYVCTAQMSYPLGKFISVATRWDMLIAATLLGSVTPIIPPELRNREAQRETHSTDHTDNGSSAVTLPGVSRLVQELRHLCGFPAARLATQHHTLLFLHRLHDDLLLRQDRQPQTSLLQITRRITAGIQSQEPSGSKTPKSIHNFIIAKPEFTSERCFRTESDLCENMVTKPLCILGNIVCIISSEMIMITN